MKIKDYEAMFYFSTGNKKLVPTESIKYLIWSLPAVTTCPFATKHCIAECYALKAEKQYPDVLPSRTRNYDFSMSDEFVDYVSDYIRKKALSRNWKKAKKIIVRIHESGDFYSIEYYEKWLAIAYKCSDIENIHFVAYTKSLPFIHYVPSNMTVRSSIWDDTSTAMILMTEEKHLPIYTACTGEEWEKLNKKNQCDCKCCSTCNKCWSKIEKLYCEIH